MTTNLDLESMVRAGAQALQRGDGSAARRLFDQVIASGRANAQVWLLQAMACKATGDVVAEEQSIDQILKADQGNIRALILKGDCRAAAGDGRAGTSYYDRAVRRAQGKQLPADLAAEVQRAEALVRAASARYRDHLEGWIGATGRAASPRFGKALDIMFGERQIFYQQPTIFYFPELPQRQFYEREEFPWVADLEALTDVICRELDGLLADRAGFGPYLVSTTDRPRTEFHGLADNPDWSTLHLFENGAPVDAHVARAPQTYAAMANIPLCRITVRAPTIMFSLLRPGAKIPPHTGQINTRLICHLPLVVPPRCGFRVGNEIREWEVGKLLIFDDTIEHEAWNDSDADRVVLIFDVWRPEITEIEKAAVIRMFEGIDAADLGV